jgi:hypothetical protein
MFFTRCLFIARGCLCHWDCHTATSGGTCWLFYSRRGFDRRCRSPPGFCSLFCLSGIFASAYRFQLAFSWPLSLLFFRRRCDFRVLEGKKTHAIGRRCKNRKWRTTNQWTRYTEVWQISRAFLVINWRKKLFTEIRHKIQAESAQYVTGETIMHKEVYCDQVFVVCSRLWTRVKQCVFCKHLSKKHNTYSKKQLLFIISITLSWKASMKHDAKDTEDHKTKKKKKVQKNTKNSYILCVFWP